MTKIKLQTYNQSEHGISSDKISPSARVIITRLLEQGFQAYIVGGAVRDLILEMHPKDFDIATNATPEQIKAVFGRECRLIGRRFRLAHVYHNREMYEVATFRGEENKGERVLKKGQIITDNVYGTLDQDSVRRDFTCNALYFDIENNTILDYCNGVRDIENKALVFIGNDSQRIIEDPVRMIRAIRFQSKLGLKVSTKMKAAIVEQYNTIANVSMARLFDELVKLFHCSNAFEAYNFMNEIQLFQKIFPQASYAIGHLVHDQEFIFKALKSTDLRIKSKKSVTPIFLFSCFLWPLAKHKSNKYQSKGNPPYDAMNKAANDVFEVTRKNISIPRIIQIGIRNIWLLQNRFEQTTSKKVFFTLDHQRFRAAYDFLILRDHENKEVEKLGQWWTHIQTLSKTKQKELIFSKKRKKKQ